MLNPQRAERLWLALAVTLLWLVVIGQQVASDSRKETMGKMSTGATASTRQHRLVVLGLAEWLVAQLEGRPLPHGKLAPEPWPATWHDIVTPSELEFLSGKTYP